jgi:CRISPR-associated protein Cmr2
MRFDLYADLAASKTRPTDSLPQGLASGFVDGCTVALFEAVRKAANGARDEARQCYVENAEKRDLKLVQNLKLEPDFSALPNPCWIGFEIAFTLETPWYSKDDRPFHVLDNPVRKDRVFGVPYMSAASWKGLLRWACRMHAGLRGYLEKHGGTLEGWKEPAWILHLFGNEKSEEEHFQRGTLAFYPTWFPKLGFEVINPHSRTTRAGTQPIYYEVVPADTPGVLRLLYAPLPGSADRDKVKSAEAVLNLVDAIHALLTTYGISAKRTVGWGTAEIGQWTAKWRDGQPICKPSLADFKRELVAWLNPAKGAR